MNVKIDTKEKFTVITPIEGRITANMTVELVDLLLACLNKAVPHVILNMQPVETIDDTTEDQLVGMQQQYTEKNSSFVICCLNKNVENSLNSRELLELLNVTPTESEAWDIVQMEEIERELLKDFDNNDNS